MQMFKAKVPGPGILEQNKVRVLSYCEKNRVT